MESKQEIGLNYEVTPLSVGTAEAEARQDIARLFPDKIGQIAASQSDTYQTPIEKQSTPEQAPLSDIEEIKRIGVNLKAMRAAKAA